MDRNLVVRRVRKRKRLMSPGLRKADRVLFSGLELLHVGTRCHLERGLRSPGKKMSSAGLCASRN